MSNPDPLETMRNYLSAVSLGLMVSVVPAIGAAPDASAIVVSERPTHAQLAKKQTDYRTQRHGSAEVRSVKPIVTVKKRSLMGMSTLLASRGHWALVPKGSIIHMPQQLKGKLVTSPQGKLQDWPVFLRENAGWIHLFPVDLAIARGHKTIDEKQMKAYQTMGKMVIATSGGYPVSVSEQALVPPTVEGKDK
ncbi:hypothetical protein JIN77_07430 [Verrucomicrobiaceae bacterium R5-34]|nr:hypothetical protein [Verrucomicrobiaceae bacterium R5-34]